MMELIEAICEILAAGPIAWVLFLIAIVIIGLVIIL